MDLYLKSTNIIKYPVPLDNLTVCYGHVPFFWQLNHLQNGPSLPWWQTHFLRMFWSQFFCVACKSQHLMWNRFWAWNSISNQPGFGESISRGVACVIFVDSFGCRIHKDDHNMSSSQGVMEIVCTLLTLLEIGYMSSIFIAFCSASTPNLLETVWSEAQKSMFLSSTCGHANDYEELHFLYWVSFHSSGVFYSCRIIHFCCHDVAASRCHSDLEQWGSRQHFESLFVGVPCCFSSSGCLIIYEIWIYYRFMMIYDVSRCIVMFLLGISSHAAKKYQTCVFDSLNGLFFSGKSTGNRSF